VNDGESQSSTFQASVSVANYGRAPTETGMSRLALSDTDKQARDWFVETTQALGCKTTIDSMGNIFAVRPGLRNDKPPTFVGSHLDTQPTGGRYDGILGVTAGVEMLKVLADNWVETEYPVGVVNWTKYAIYALYIETGLT
jgi:acetylornithine deacetylase/succinyl-diaminopimelate desuccinylase-like protein